MKVDVFSLTIHIFSSCQQLCFVSKKLEVSAVWTAAESTAPVANALSARVSDCFVQPLKDKYHILYNS